MSKICQITGKKAMIGNNVSHSKRRTKRTFDLNLFNKKFYLIFIVLYLYFFQTGRKVSTFIRIKQEFPKIIHFQAPIFLYLSKSRSINSALLPALSIFMLLPRFVSCL